uniref:C2H2-type domain-containing protein n=1 Tax=Entomoneis paludosa TaxID=265537 RepID=A0A7S2Y670_9STRA
MQYSLDQQQTVQAALETHTHRMIRKTTSENLCTTVIQVDPSLYRDLSDVMSSVDGTLEILEQVVMSQQGDMDLEQQLEINNRKQQVADQVGVSRDEEDGQDSDVEDLVEKLESIRHTSGADEDDDKHDDKHVSLNGDDDDDDDIYNGSAPSSRKQQKKNRKKSKKQKRREQEEEEERLRIAENEKRRQEERQQKLGQKKTPGEEEQSAAPNITPPRQQEKGQDGAKSCNTCGGAFANAAEYRAHFRSDWHRFNQKLKLKGVTPVSEEEFLLCDADTFFGGV